MVFDYTFLLSCPKALVASLSALHYKLPRSKHLFQWCLTLWSCEPDEWHGAGLQFHGQGQSVCLIQHEVGMWGWSMGAIWHVSLALPLDPVAEQCVHWI